MKPRAFYNDNDPKVCAWVRELMADGLIMEGDVDERSIKEIQPEELRGYTRIHLFCGIAGWDLALQLAGWPADRSVLTCSAPCQSFSCAGQGKGVNDPRHLWPEAFRIIRALKSQCVIGEQVAAAIGHGWLDGICDDLEGEGYTTGAVVLGAFSVGSPHIRQRLYWVGYAQGIGWNGRQNNEDSGRRELASGHSGTGDSRVAVPQSEQSHGSRDARGGRGESSDSSNNGGLADASSPRCVGPLGESESQARDEARVLVSGEHGEDGGLADSNGGNPGAEREQRSRGLVQQPKDEGTGGMEYPAGDGREQRRATSGERSTERGCGAGWSDYELIPCADGKARRIKSGLQPLAHGISEALACVFARQAIVWLEISTYAAARKTNSGEIMRMVREAVQQGESGEKPATGMCSQFPAPQVLLDLLLGAEAARDRTADSRCGKKEGAEIINRAMHSVRGDSRTLRPSHRREPDKQQAGEPPATLPELSLVLARHAEAYREEVVAAHATLNRITLLRGAGNAIVPQVAAQFIKAMMGLDSR